jgi:hypothetical protein
MNWVLVPLAVYRDALLGCTRQMPRLSVAERKLYIQGAPPITPERQAVAFERLLAALVEGFAALIAWLQSNPEGMLEATPPGLELSFGATVAENFALLCWHDSYHVGQLAVLRELALSRRGE